MSPIKIIRLAEDVLNFHIGHIPIDLTRKTGVLIRQSRKKADKENYESRLLQENLVPIAIECRGDTDDRNILLYDEGAGISGQKGYDERPELSKLYLDIANDIVGSLFVARPDRLFRDKHFTNVSMFTELAERKKLILVVPGKRFYDFTKYADLVAFQEDMRDAYKYIATHIQYMIDTRKQKRQRGLYAGGSLPAPYAIDKLAWKDEQIPIIYEPWLEPAIDLFTRFKAFDFSMAHIGRYIESLPYIFPEPSHEGRKKYMFLVTMLYVNGGYSFGQIGNVKGYLSNLALGGYMKIGKDEDDVDMYLPDAFDAAIPFDLLDECYAAIKGYHIDGTPWEGARNTKRYMRNNPKGAFGLLHNIATSDQGHIRVNTDTVRGYHKYDCERELSKEEERTWKLRHLVENLRLWSLSCLEVDRIMLDRLYAIAQYNDKMAERVKSVFDSMKGKEMDESKLLREQADKITRRIERLDFLLTNPDIPLDKETAIEYAQEKAELRPKLARIYKKLQAKPDIDPERTVTDFYSILSRVTTEFEKQGIDVQKQIMSKLVNKVVLNNLSPHLFHLYIEWQEGVAFQTDIALLWRGVAVKDKNGWSEDEDKAIRTYWPDGSEIDILSHIPQRNRMSIAVRASDLGVKRLVKDRWQYSYHKSIAYADLQAVEQFVACLDGRVAKEDQYQVKERLLKKVNEMAAETSKGEITAYFPIKAEVLGSFLMVGDDGDQTNLATCT